MRKMKDSGIAWIGEIPETWKVGRIFLVVKGSYPEGTDIKTYPCGFVEFRR